MLCHSLITIVRDSCRLVNGSLVDEPKLRPEATFTTAELYFYHLGKDDSIADMLENGNGFGERDYLSPLSKTSFDLGIQQERRDLKALKFWMMSLDNCKFDRARGATS